MTSSPLTKFHKSKERAPHKTGRATRPLAMDSSMSRESRPRCPATDCRQQPPSVKATWRFNGLTGLLPPAVAKCCSRRRVPERLSEVSTVRRHLPQRDFWGPLLPFDWLCLTRPSVYCKGRCSLDTHGSRPTRTARCNRGELLSHRASIRILKQAQ
jgi:hypothetical protein